MTTTMKTSSRPLAAAALLAALLAAAPAHAAWNKDWTSHTRIVLDTGDKGLALPAAQADVVVPVRLHSGNFDFAAAKPDGSDLRVIAGDDRTPLTFEVERYDAVNELALLWVRVPSVAAGTVDKNVIHVYAGNPTANAATGSVFATGYAAALHFAEADGAAVDAVSGAKSAAPVVREGNGLLGASARLDGTASISLPASDRLKIAAGAPVSLALWIKPEAVAGNAPATLASLGALKLMRQGDQLVADLGGKTITGGALPAGAWAHVGVSVNAGKATLYVNGKPAGQGDAALPALDGALEVGAGYRGLVDEVELLPAARDDGWFRLQAASQGADAAFMHGVREAGAEEGGGSGYFGVLLKNLTTDAWVVIGILMVMFAVALWVMVTKGLFVARASRANDAFLQKFREVGGELQVAKEFNEAPLFRLYSAGVREVGKRQATGRMALSGASLNAIKAVLDADLVRLNHGLNARMVLLTIAISGGPFLGLLGTVVGVMITFAAIAAAGDVNVNAIAPGIAAALMATVAGLGVAIPSLFGYNYLAARIKNLSADMQIFVDEFVTRAAETHGAP
jgi:biopolymer transport protein ExbB